MSAIFFIFQSGTKFVSLLKAVKDRYTGSLFDEPDMLSATAPANSKVVIAPSVVPGVKKVAATKKPLPAATIASLFDEVLHPRAGEGMTLVNPETGQIIHGGQFAPKLDKDDKKHDRGRRNAQSENGPGGAGVSPEPDGESPGSGKRFSDKRKTRTTSRGASESLFGQGSLFDQGGRDASAGSAGGSGSGLSSSAGSGTGAGPAGVGSRGAASDDSAADRVEQERQELGYAESELSADTEGASDGVHTISAPRKVGYDYRITDADQVGRGGFRQKLVDNLEALRLLKELDAEGRKATPDEQARLVKYTGWGWAQALFNQRNIMRGGRYEHEYAALAELLIAGDDLWLKRATILAEYSLANVDAGHSLYKGSIGIATLLADIANPEDARMSFDC